MTTPDPGGSSVPVPPSGLPPRTGFSSMRDLTGYQWWVFSFAVLAWMADCMDQQMFNLGRPSAMGELGGGFNPIDNGTIATSIFLVGWAIGGIIFGIFGDRLGRVRTLTITILIYSLFTGLSAASITIYDYWAYRFLCGLGVGGVFSAAVALLAEEMPDRARPFSLGMMQAFSAIGNCTAAVLFIILGLLELNGYLESLKPLTAWRLLFLIGLVPAVMVIFIRSKLHEPLVWQEARDRHAEDVTRKLGSYKELFSDPRWGKNALFGLMLAFSGVVGLWAIGFFAGDLRQQIFQARYKEEAFTLYLGSAEPETLATYTTPEGKIDYPKIEADLSSGVVSDMQHYIAGQNTIWNGITFMVINIGAFFGMFSFSWLTSRIGRRPAFLITLIMAMLSTIAVFALMTERWHILVLVPIMGFFQLALFGGYAIYFPELFPTRLRSTGTAFCYNVGRLIAATGPLALGLLTTSVFSKENGFEEGMRYAGVCMCSVFLLGIIALPFLPETKDQPLPE